MVITSHTAASALIIKLVPNKIAAIFLILASHFVLDAIPHAQPPTTEGYRPKKITYWLILLDIVVTICLLVFFMGRIDQSYLLLGTFLSILPDLLDTTRYLKKRPKIFDKYYLFHDKIQNETNGAIGYLTQIVLILLAIGAYL